MRLRRSKFLTLWAIATAIFAIGAVAAPSASARVSTTPAVWTPTIGADSAVYRMAQCGNIMFVVGQFTSVTQRGKHYYRPNAFSFNAKTGALTSWNPQLDGPGYGLAISRNCAIAYVGGTFTHVGYDAAKNFAAISTRSGKLYTPVAHDANATVRTIALVNGGRQLLVGGYFTTINSATTKYYVSLDPLTGAQTTYLRASVAGKIPIATKGYSMVWNQQVSHSGRELLIEGDFTMVGGHQHVQIAELNLSSTMASVASWTSAQINNTNCSVNTPFYIRGAAFSPDTRTIYIAATGYTGSSPFCDGVTAFTNERNARVKWINKTGRDSLYTVAAGTSDVYVGGHERWANNPLGHDSCGSGCVVRQGIGDISATTGKATAWNPTRSRGHGATEMLITSAGLWVGSDTYYNSKWCGGHSHGGICFFPGRA